MSVSWRALETVYPYLSDVSRKGVDKWSLSDAERVKVESQRYFPGGFSPCRRYSRRADSVPRKKRWHQGAFNEAS